VRAVGIISLLVWPVLRTFFIDKLSLLSKSHSSGHPVLVTTQRGKGGGIIDALDCGHGDIWVFSVWLYACATVNRLFSTWVTRLGAIVR
jgi:hypothetical protein